MPGTEMTTLAELEKEECLLTPGTVPGLQSEGCLQTESSSGPHGSEAGPGRGSPPHRCRVGGQHTQQSWEWRLPCCWGWGRAWGEGEEGGGGSLSGWGEGGEEGEVGAFRDGGGEEWGVGVGGMGGWRWGHAEGEGRGRVCSQLLPTPLTSPLVHFTWQEYFLPPNLIRFPFVPHPQLSCVAG